MFRITCLVDDRKLADALRSLAALGAYEVEPSPVTNAQASRGKVKDEGTLSEMFLAALISNKAAGFHVNDAKKFAVSKGKQASAAGYIVQQLTKAKQIKNVSRGLYQLTVKK